MTGRLARRWLIGGLISRMHGCFNICEREVVYWIDGYMDE